MNNTEKKILKEHEKEIEILMKDRCTEAEAINFLKNGTVIWENPTEWINNLKETGCYNGETIDDARVGKLTNISTVIFDNHEYIIEYVG